MGARSPRGVGVGLRRELWDAVVATSRRVDWLEIVPENFMGLGGRPASVLAACRERWPIVTHGVGLSLGGRDPLDDYLDALAPLVDGLDAPFVSDHACWATDGGRASFDLLPLPFTEEAAAHLARRARHASARVGRPILLENITYYATMPGGTMTEGAFLRAVLEQAGAYLLLDVANVHVNAKNRGRDPFDALRELPLDRVRQIHVAGSSRENDLLLDTHDRPASSEVLELLAAAVAIVGDVPVLVEWDQRIPGLDAVLDEADRVRAVVEAALPAAVTARAS